MCHDIVTCRWPTLFNINPNSHMFLSGNLLDRHELPVNDVFNHKLVMFKTELTAYVLDAGHSFALWLERIHNLCKLFIGFHTCTLFDIQNNKALFDPIWHHLPFVLYLFFSLTILLGHCRIWCARLLKIKPWVTLAEIISFIHTTRVLHVAAKCFMETFS